MLLNRLFIFFIFLFLWNCFFYTRTPYPKDATPILLIDGYNKNIQFCIYKEFLDNEQCKVVPSEDIECPFIHPIHKPEQVKNIVYKGLSFIELKYPGFQLSKPRVLLLSAPVETEEMLTKMRFQPEKIDITPEDISESIYYSQSNILPAEENWAILDYEKSSINFAYSNSGTVLEVTEPIGIEEIYETIQKNPEYKDDCFQLPSEFFIREEGENHFNSCKEFLEKNYFTTSKYYISKTASSLKVYGSGQFWRSIFQDNENKPFLKEDFIKIGEKVCGITINKFKKNGISTENANLKCFLYSYSSLLFDNLGIESIYPSQASYSLGIFFNKKLNLCKKQDK